MLGSSLPFPAGLSSAWASLTISRVISTFPWKHKTSRYNEQAMTTGLGILNMTENHLSSNAVSFKIFCIEQLQWHPLPFILKSKHMQSCCGSRRKQSPWRTLFPRTPAQRFGSIFGLSGTKMERQGIWMRLHVVFALSRLQGSSTNFPLTFTISQRSSSG